MGTSVIDYALGTVLDEILEQLQCLCANVEELKVRLLLMQNELSLYVLGRTLYI